MSLKRITRIAVLVLLVGLPLVVGVTFAMMLQDKPLLSGKLTMSPADIKRAKQLIASHDPRRLRDGESRWLVIRETDFTLMANYVLQQFPLFRGRGWLRVETEPDLLTLEATVLLADNPLGRYLNIRVLFTDKGLIPDLASVHIGSFPVPRNLAVILLGYVVDKARQRADLRLALQSVKDISMNRDTLVMRYQWDTKLLEHARSLLVSPADQQRLVFYKQFLSAYIHQSARSHRVPIYDLMQAVFAEAHTRSSAQSAAAENRAAIIMLATYVNGINITSLVPAVRKFSRLDRRKVTLQGRHDLAQHYILSAAISATGGSALSNMVGMFKEIEDSRYGSGFNFSDLTADRAGTRFGEMATRSHEDAIRMQQRLLSLRHEKTLLPYIADISRGMRDTEFTQRYGNTDSATYQDMVLKIDRRIAGLEFYKTN